jgi:outer membrane protein OmpA-like peptidoglycan-associated protein
MHPRIGRQAHLTALFCVLVVVALPGGRPAPALAQNPPTLKEILERAQSEAQRKAVEDLIDKLQGSPPKPAAPTQPGPQSDGAVAGSQQPSEQAGDKPVVSVQPSQDKPVVSAQPSGDKPAASAQPPEDKPGVTPQAKEATTTEKAEQPSPDTAAAASAPEQKEAASSSGEPKASSSAVVISPEAAIKSAAQDELPSVDLEVFFDFDSAEITPPAVEALATLGRALSDQRLANDTFLIAGHTDAKGRRSYNRRLSSMRARAVRDFIVANFGVDPSRIKTQGFGSSHLKNPDEPLAGENRRVQIVNLVKRKAR